MRRIDPGNTPTRDLHQYLLASVAPRPIAFVSTISEGGIANLAPYSFFNCFSSNPPILVFSSNRRVTDNTTKDTLANIRATGECVIHAVSHEMVRQMAVASVEFSPDVNEFEKTGFTPIASELVRPFRVKESPVHMECKLHDIITLGDKGGAGHLIICNVVLMHINEAVIDERNRIDPQKLDLMGRMGRAFYVRAQGEAVLPIVQEILKPVIGYDGLPEHIKQSKILSANNLGQLAGMEHLPNGLNMKEISEIPEVATALSDNDPKTALHKLAKQLLDEDDDRSMAASVLQLSMNL